MSALRTALVGRAVLRFDGPGVDGPAPSLGRVIEHVNRTGRRIQIGWDDGLILHTRLGLAGAWHLYREGEPWRKPFAQVRVAITVRGWVAACFNAPVVETYREFDRHRHPSFGRTAPDLSGRGPDVAGCAQRLGGYHDRDAPVLDVLLDPHVVVGLGNVQRSEVLWRCGLHPFARVGDLTSGECLQLVGTAAALLQRNADYALAADPVDTRDDLVVYGRNGQRCGRCGDTIQVRRIGEHQRVLYWCAGCQTAHDPHQVELDEAPMDPRPAAARYVVDSPWRRSDLAG
ncbi:MAG: nei [Ilumatobacteraceae bacterium]|nr:nei [Ilumatobacteraceae bacterium]